MTIEKISNAAEKYATQAFYYEGSASAFEQGALSPEAEEYWFEKFKNNNMKQLVDWNLKEIITFPGFISIQKVMGDPISPDPLSPTMYIVTFESAIRETSDSMRWITVTGDKIAIKRYSFYTYLQQDLYIPATGREHDKEEKSSL